jgi:hypothetical protein
MSRRVARRGAQPPGRTSPSQRKGSRLGARRAAWLLPCGVAVLTTPAEAAETVTVVANGQRVLVEVADTFEARSRGLMFRNSLPADRGMLFVYPSADRHCMWMRNTALPLSVAFLDEHRAVINVAEMAPQTDARHCAERAARYVLEMPAGWLARHGVGPGARLEFTVAPARE